MLPCAHRETFTVRNHLSEIERLSRELETFAARVGLPPDTLFAVNLALEEVVTNAIVHGYDDDAEHVIAVMIGVDGDDVDVTVEDDGRPFNPLAHPPPDVTAPLEERRVGGVGVLLLRRLMDDVRYARVDGKNVLEFRKRRSGPA